MNEKLTPQAHPRRAGASMTETATQSRRWVQRMVRRLCQHLHEQLFGYLTIFSCLMAASWYGCDHLPEWYQRFLVSLPMGTVGQGGTIWTHVAEDAWENRKALLACETLLTSCLFLVRRNRRLVKTLDALMRSERSRGDLAAQTVIT
jgi:hypothetical protein